ncbi:retrotransposon protein, putative, ty1-copia subclass [Tanacetum coccineum]
MVLRVEMKLFVIEKPISPAPPADSKYLRSGMWFMMLIMRLLVLRSKKEGKPVGPYVIKIKNYVAQLERLGYVLLQDLSVGLTINGLTSDFAGFVRNYNKHNMGKTIGELHALLIEYEKGLPKKAATPQVMAIQGGRIQKANKKSLNAKGKGKRKGKGKDKSYIPKPKNPKPYAKEHPVKDDTCHHYKEVGHCKRNCPAYLAELIKKKKQVGTASSLDIFIIELFSFPTKSWVYDTSCGTHICNTKHGLRGVRKLKQVEAIGSFDLVLHNGLGCEALVKRDTPDKLQQRSVNGRAVELEDTSPSKNTSKIPMEVEGFEPPQEELILVDRKDVGIKWLFKKKTDMEDNVHTHKARLVATGFTQTIGVDYEETFSPVANIKAIRILIDIATFYDYEIWQMDVKIAFLNGYLDEDIYMVNPEAELRVDCYCNAGFEIDRDEIKSQTGYVFILKGRRSRLEELQAKLGIVPTIYEPIKMFCDNSATLLIANEPGVQMGARHYHRRYFLKVHTDNNLADPFKKALPKGKLTQHARSMGLRLVSSFM